jgi:hypothetical protein
MASEQQFISSNKQPFDSLGLFTYLRTYARRLDEEDPHSAVETWNECVSRIVNGCNSQLDVGFTNEEKQEFFDLIFNLKCSVAGRFLWQLGTKTVNTLGLMSLQNCAFTVMDEPVKPFTWIMNFLMLGAGCGYRVTPEDVAKFPVVHHVTIKRHDTKDVDYIVPDTRQGWIKLLGKLLKAHFYSGEGFTYSCMLLRSKGAPIKGFGGLSSGPEVLCDGLDKINNILNGKAGSNVSTVDVLDICNIIGMIVVSGNVRRCLPKGSMVHVENGMIPIENIKVGMKVLTTKGFKSVKNTFVQGVQPLVTIKTENGEFYCTANHKMAVYKSHTEYAWKEAGKLTSYDLLCTTQYSEPTYNKSIIDNDLIWFLGFAYSNTPCKQFLCHEYELAQFVTTQLSRFGDMSMLNVSGNRYTVHCDAINFRKFRDVYEADRVPSFMFTASTVDRYSYIKGVIESRGYRFNGIRENSYISKTPFVINTTSKLFAQDIQNLLASLGQQTHLSIDNIGYSVAIHICDYNTLDCKMVYPVKIESVFESNSAETFDIEVDEMHEFFCNGYLTHNSAQIAIGSSTDHEYMKAKRWDLGMIPNWRCYSNNSVICNDIADIIDNEDFWAGYSGNGEPYGLINLKLTQSCGRLGETKYPDPTVEGFNPCAEQGLARWETCCLGEIYLPNISTFEELKKCTTYIYRACKHSLSLPCVDSKETEKIVHSNFRMGIGVTGYLQATEEQRNWLKECYTYLREFDVEYSKLKGFPPSVKLTTCKPSGCSRGDMMVQTNRGLLRLDEIGDVNGDVWQPVEDLQVMTDDNTMQKVTKFYVNGNVKTRKIITSDGMELESSLNHQYRVCNDGKYEWKTVENLVCGDMLVVKLGGHQNTNVLLKRLECPQSVFMPPMFMSMSKEIATFIGLFYTFGCIVDNNIHLFNCQQSLVDWVKRFMQFSFGFDVFLGEHSCYITSAYLIQWLRLNGCDDISKGVPTIIKQSSIDCIKAFICGKLGKTDSLPVCWSMCSNQKQFLLEMFQLARSIGCNVYMSTCKFCVSQQSETNCSLMCRVAEEIDVSRQFGDFWLDPISSIVESECNTYDIEVENVHHYKIGGVISHNTLSLLGHCTSGVHPGFAQYYIRRIRVSSESKLIGIAKSHGYHIEYVQNFDGTPDYNTQVISFPYALPEGTVLAENCTAVDQLEYVKRLQTEWSDNSVSVTVYYKKEELESIKDWLRVNYNDSVKTVSFLLHSEHGFKQAPLEKISKKQYEEMMRQTTPITSVTSICYNALDDKFIADGECAGGVCPLK